MIFHITAQLFILLSILFAFDTDPINFASHSLFDRTRPPKRISAVRHHLTNRLGNAIGIIGVAHDHFVKRRSLDDLWLTAIVMPWIMPTQCWIDEILRRCRLLCMLCEPQLQLARNPTDCARRIGVDFVIRDYRHWHIGGDCGCKFCVILRPQRMTQFTFNAIARI